MDTSSDRRRELNCRFWRTFLWVCASDWRANVAEWLVVAAVVLVVLLALRLAL